MGTFRKIDYLRRQPWIGDYNLLVDTVNKLIDEVTKKKEIAELVIERQVKDFTFFKWEEVKLPYEATYSITTPDEATNIFSQYAFTFKEMNSVNKLIQEGKIISLKVNVTEEVTEKEEKQEMIFETVEAISIEEVNKKAKQKKTKVGQTTTKKRGRKKTK